MSLALDPNAHYPAVPVTGSPPPRRPFPPWQLIVSLLILTVIICGVAAQAAYHLEKRRPDVWLAESTIEYRGTSWPESQQEALGSYSLTGPIAVAEGIEQKEFDKNLNTALIAGTQVLRIQYQDEDEAKALRVVERLTAVYIDTFSEPPVAQNAAIERLEDQVLQLQGQIFQTEIQIAQIELAPNAPEPPEMRLLETRLASLLTSKENIELRIDELVLERLKTEEIQPRVFTAPYVQDQRVAPAPMRRAVLGLLAGLVLSGFLWLVAVRRYVSWSTA